MRRSTRLLSLLVLLATAHCGDDLLNEFPRADTDADPDVSADSGDGDVETTDGGPDAIPVPPVVIITEMMVHPLRVDTPKGEWIELHNPGTEPVDIAGWRIADDGTDKHVIADRLVIAAGGYVVLGSNANVDTNGGVVVDYEYSSIELSNQADEIALSVDGVEVDRVHYDVAQGWPSRDGAALSLSPTALNAASNDDPTHWCVASAPFGTGDLGSPGQANPACEIFCGDGVAQLGEACDDRNTRSGDGCSRTCEIESFQAGQVVITELMPDPAAVDDADGEYVELYNPSGDTPVDVGGLVLEDDEGNDAYIIANGAPAVIAPGGYLVLGANALPSENGGVPVDFEWRGLTLNNGGQTLRLRWLDVTLDAVTYDGGVTWPWTTGAATGLHPGILGQAGSPIPHTDNDDPANWCPATRELDGGDLGTPGAPNDACVIITCGNGKPDLDEPCDDGNDVPCDGCEADCTVTVDDDLDQVCDGEDNCLGVQNPMQIDSDEDGAGDLCDVPECGNAFVEDGETCDDGGDVPGDGCSADCLEEAFSPGDIVVTELLVDPTGQLDGDAEFIELYNPGAAPVDLAGWVLSDDGSNSHVIAGPLVVAPEGYVVLGLSDDTDLNGGLILDYVYSSFALTNDLDDEVVLSWNDVEIDRVDLHPAFPEVPGASLSLEPRYLDGVANDDAHNWCRGVDEYGSSNLGSPGVANPPCGASFLCGNGLTEGDLGETCDDGVALNSDTVADACRTTCELARCGDGVTDSDETCDGGAAMSCGPDCELIVAPVPGALLVTELMANPEAATEPAGEWFEVFNVSETAIDLFGWTLGSGDKTHTVSESVVVLPGDYAVLGRSADPAANGGLVVDYVYGTLTFKNSGTDNITLVYGADTPDPIVIDEVLYTTGTTGGWSIPAGRSLQLNPLIYASLAMPNAAVNDAASSWCAPSMTPIDEGATAPPSDFGTPGVGNDPCGL
ncbi:MAG: cysteine-rich repeat protein [Myxococcota bacterium]|jgi:cysteine-rich repeat protein